MNTGRSLSTSEGMPPTKEEGMPPTKRHDPHAALDPALMQNFLNDAGFGRFQIMMLVMCGGVMFSEGSEMLVMGSITTLLHDHWQLTAFLR